MKKHSFLAGMLTMALIGSLGMGALAATGRMTIEVDPINIQVNGETFQPKDANGNTVPVFAYNGTTYAPLRALAEAYGLEVGYDAEAKMATVGVAPVDAASTADYSDWTAEEEAAYQEFKGMWVTTPGGGDRIYMVSVKYSGTLSQQDVEDYLLAHCAYIVRMSYELGVSSAPQTIIEFYWSETRIANVLMDKSSIWAAFVGDVRVDLT